ncbi:MAG: hypothetical protein MJ110_01265 [Lachnospiraceae bacterium]|nr:hypothetical protein [Lachnospiraceae bacterium]
MSEMEELHPKLAAFFDAESLEEKYNAACRFNNDITDHFINTMAYSLDMNIPEGKLDLRYQALLKAIKTRMTYERNRDRR